MAERERGMAIGQVSKRNGKRIRETEGKEMKGVN
jgi:hypothetical protein